MIKTTKSPSNTYVAMCNKTNFDGFYFRKFTLPERCVEEGVSPSWYFLNILNGTACLEKIITFEDFTNVKEEGKEEDNLFQRAVNFGANLGKEVTGA